MIRPQLLAATATLALAAAPALAQERTLTISVYAFAQDAFQEIVYTPFEKICGCKVVVETGNSVERLAKLEANKAAPVIDMAVLSTQDALAADRAGLIDAVDTAKLENFDKLYDIAKDPLGDGKAVGYTFYATSIAYRSDLVQIDSWQDLFKPELKGQVALPDVTTNQGPPTLYMIGKAMGSDAADLDAPITEVGQHAEDITTFYVRSSQLAQLFQQEEVVAAPIGRFSWAQFKDTGLPIAWATPKEGQTGGMNVMVATKGAKNADLALQFMDFWLSTPVQTALAEKLIDSPANKEVVVSPEIADNLTYGADTVANLHLIPADVWLDNREAWVAAWNAKVAK